jgi:hypothetical protein
MALPPLRFATSWGLRIADLGARKRHAAKRARKATPPSATARMHRRGEQDAGAQESRLEGAERSRSAAQ